MKRNSSRRLWALCVLVASCGDPAGPSHPAVATVEIAPDTVLLRTTQRRTLVATAKDGDGAAIPGLSAVWASQTPGVATVNDSGTITAVAVGLDTITATIAGAKGTAVVTVTAIPVTTVTVAPAPTTLYVGQGRALTATAKDSVGQVLAGRPVTWTSGDTSRATVSNAGVVTAKQVGTVVVTATVEGIGGTDSVQVALVPVSTVSLLPAGDTVAIGDTIRPVAIPRDSAGTPIAGRAVTWQVGDSALLTPLPGGRFVVDDSGTTTISATVDGVTKGGAIAAHACGDTIQMAANAFHFPLVSGALANDPGGTTDAGLFRSVEAWYGGGLLYGLDSATTVLAHDPSLNLAPGLATRWICQLPVVGLGSYTYAKVDAKAGLNHPQRLRIVQETFATPTPTADSGYVLFRFTITDTASGAVGGLRVGYLVDWDLGLSPGTNLLRWYPAQGVAQAQESDTLTHPERLTLIGIAAAGAATSHGWINGADPSSRGAYFPLLASANQTATTGPGDIRQLIALPPLTITGYNRVVVYFAVVGGKDAASFAASLAAAKARASALGF